MKVFIPIALCAFMTACSEGNYSRGYVISKFHAEPEPHVEAEPEETSE